MLALAAVGILLTRPSLVRKPPPIKAAPAGRFVTVDQYESSLTFRTKDGLIVTVAGISVDTMDEAARARAGARLREIAPTGSVVFIERDLGALPPGGSVKASVYILPPGMPHTLPLPYPETHLAAGILVEEGLVRVDENQPYLFQRELVFAQYEAERHERGLWAPKK